MLKCRTKGNRTRPRPESQEREEAGVRERKKGILKTGGKELIFIALKKESRNNRSAAEKMNLG